MDSILSEDRRQDSGEVLGSGHAGSGDERASMSALKPAQDETGRDAGRSACGSGKNEDHISEPPILHATEAAASGFRCPSVPVMVIALLMFAAFSQSFSSTCITLFINMDLGYGPVEVTRYWMYVGYTSWFQPLLGIASDWFVILEEKRRPLFVLCAVGNTIIYSIFCFNSAATSACGTFVAVSIVANFCTMGIYIPLNGILVEVGRADGETHEESVARVSAIMAKAMVYRSVGSLAGTVLHTCLVVKLSVHTMLGFSAILFAALIPLVLLTPRALFLRKAAQQENYCKRMREAGLAIKESFRLGDCRSDGFCFALVLLFVFVYTLMPDASSVYYNYLYGAFRFDTWFYSMNGCIGYVGSIAGAYVFSLWMDYRAREEHDHRGVRTSIFFIFTIGCLAWAFGYLTNLLLCTGFVVDVLHIPAAVYIPIDNFFTSLFVRFAFMPTIVMAAEHAPKNFEATAFEVFSVASMGGGTLSALITSFIAEGLHITRADYGNLWILLVISIVCKLVPIPIAYVLPERRSDGDGGHLMPRHEDAEQLVLEDSFSFDVPDKQNGTSMDDGAKAVTTAVVVEVGGRGEGHDKERRRRRAELMTKRETMKYPNTVQQ